MGKCMENPFLRRQIDIGWVGDVCAVRIVRTLSLRHIQETQLSLRDRATRACQLKSGKVLHKCRRLVFEKL